MTLESFLNLFTQIIFLAVAGITVSNWFKNRDRASADIALMFASLALAIITEDTEGRLPSISALLTIVFVLAILVQPYLLLRVIRYFHPVSVRVQQAALMGLILVIGSILVSGSTTVFATILFIAYFMVLEIYASVLLVRGAITIPGITGKRLRLASFGSGFFALVFIFAFVLILFALATKTKELPVNVQSIVGAVLQILALLSGLSYYFGFSPPRWLRQYWQLSELPNFMRQDTNRKVNSRSAVFDELIIGSLYTVGGAAALIAHSDISGKNLNIEIQDRQILQIKNLEKTLGPISEAWAQRKATILHLPVEMPEELQGWTKQLLAETLFLIPIISPVRTWGLLIVALRYAPLFAQDDLNMLALLVERSVIPLDYSVLVDDALNASEQRFAKAFTSSPVAITITRVKDGKVVDVNTAWTELFGYAREEAIGKTSVELGITTTETRQKMMGEIKEKGVIRNIEAMVLNRLGEERNVFLSMEAITLNEEPCAITTMVDITERKEAEEKISYQAYLLENVNDAVIGSDVDTIIRFWNHGAERMFGWQAEEVIGQSGSEILRSEFPNTNRDEVLETLAATGRWKGEAIQFRRDGSPVTAEISTITLYDDNGQVTGYVSVSRDVTERKQAELALQENESNARSLLRLSKQLEQAQSHSEALLAALGEVKHVIGYQNAWIYLLSENKQELQLLTTTGALSETIMDDFPTLTITGDPFLEEIFSGSNIVLVEDAPTDSRTNKEIVAQLGNRTIVNVPIMLLDKHLGAFGTGSFGDEGIKVPTSVQLEYLETLASHLAITFDRIHLLNQRKQVEEQIRQLNAELEQRVKERTEQLLESEEKFSKAFLNSPAAVSIASMPDGRYINVNDALATLTGYSKEELIGHTSSELGLVDSTSREKILEATQKYGTVRNVEIQIRTKSKQMADVLTSIERIDIAGKPCMLSVNYDITERKRAEAEVERLNHDLEQRQVALSEANALLQTMMDNTPDHIYFKDANSHFIRNSRSQAIMMGLQDSNEVVGKSDFDFFPKEHAEQSLEEEKQVMNGHPLLDIEERVVWPDGRLTWVSTTKLPLHDSNGNTVGTFGISRDITTRKHTEEELKKSNTQLEATNKELEAFSYSVSHDLRAPLRTIDGFSQAVIEDYGDKLSDEGRSYLERVRKAAQHMAELIDDLLNLSRVTRAVMTAEDVNLSELAKSILKNLQETQPERKVDLMIASNLTARGDSRLLQVALENLLNNAWKFTSKLEKAHIEFGSKEDKEEQVFFIRDNGAGFDMTYASKLFGAFQRLHAMNDFPGTGIGLATVQRIINRHGGRIWVESAINQGTTFYFTLL